MRATVKNIFYLESFFRALIKQIFHAFLFNIRTYSPKVINSKRPEANCYIILPRVNDFDIKQKRQIIFALLYATNTKQDLQT